MAVLATVLAVPALADTAQTPTNLTASLSSGGTSVSLSWDATDPDRWYNVKRKNTTERETDFTGVATTGSTSHTDSWLLKPGRNTYYVTSFHWSSAGDHESGPSNSVTVLVPDPDGTGGL